VGVGRGRRWFLAGVVALVAVVAAGASAPTVGAGARSSILFTPADASMAVGSISDSNGQSIEVDFAPDKPPLPRNVVIEVPTGYTLDLAAKSGTEVGQASISIVGVNDPSFAIGFGSLVAKDVAESLSDPRAQECAPGAHAAVWALSTSLAGQQVSLSVYVDRGSQAGLAYVMHACSTGLSSDANSAASISLNLEGLVAPTAPGDYRWRALVAPQTRPAYELQALLPLPESVSVRARYDRKRKTAVVTGRVIEGGKPLARADVTILGRRNDRTISFFEARTNVQGAYTRSVRVSGTTDFTVFVGPNVGPCTASSTLPGGCLGSTTIAPDAGSATLWVSPPTGAARVISMRDQRRAEKIGLNASDFPEGFEQAASGGDDCLNPRHESKLTITGESASPAFYRYDLGDPPSAIQAVGLTRVYATTKQAQQAFAHQARVPTVRCVVNNLGLDANDRPPIRALRLPKISARLRAFRATFSVEPGFSANYDVLFLQRGRAVTLLRVALLNSPSDFETQLTAALASRMR
jgi:hypothetical protein